jgi:peptide-methionine (R)-S-oxide reductase
MKNKLFILLILFSLFSCQGQDKTKNKKLEIQKSEAQWKKELTPEQFEVLREKGTERPFSGKYVNTFDKGTYVCAACANLLFYSDAKFHSDCGWPSFDKAIKGSVTYITDSSFGMSRTEVNCAKCGGHLGHIFDDGPTKTGQRFCTNSVSVKFIPSK